MDTSDKPVWKVRVLTDLASDDVEIVVVHTSASADLPANVQIELANHDEIDSYWCASVGCTLDHSGVSWRGTVQFGGDEPRLIQVTRLHDGQDPPTDLLLDPAASIHLEPPVPGEWTTGDETSEELERRIAAREAFFSQSLEAPDSQNDAPTYSAVMLAENVHLTVGHRVPGLAILPLQNPTVGVDVVMVLNDVLPGLGYPLAFDPNEWLSLTRSRNPSAIVHAPSIRANNEEEAQNHVSRQARRLLDITALRRGAKPRLLAGILLKRTSDGDLQARPWIEGSGYSGNLLGGFISGEDAHGLVDIWNETKKDGRTQLWLSMHADGIGDSRPDYRFFRAFNLLEAIASETVPSKTTILGDTGRPLLMTNGKPYTTDHARGKVFELLRHVATNGSISLSSFATPSHSPIASQANAFTQVPGDIWSELGLWVKIRNAVAHRGTLRLPEGETPDAKRMLLESMVSGFSFDSSGFASGFGALSRTIASDCEIVLYQAIKGRL